MKKVYHRAMDTGINQRLLEIRKLKGRNQSQFANDLQMTQASISKMEAGLIPITEKTVKLICLTFHVSEQWLRTGEGAMFKSEDFPRCDELLEIFRSLSDEMQTLFLDLGRTLLSSQKEKKTVDPA